MNFIIKKKSKCPLPGLNQRPQDLQSYALPAELNRLHNLLPNLVIRIELNYFINKESNKCNLIGHFFANLEIFRKNDFKLVFYNQ